MSRQRDFAIPPYSSKRTVSGRKLMSALCCRSLKPVLIFTGLYMVMAIAGAIAAGNREFIIYIGVMMVLIQSIYTVHRRYPLIPPLLCRPIIYST